VNPALAAMLGVPSGALEGRPIAETFARDPHLVELFAMLREGSGAGDDVETYLTSRSGGTHSVAVRASIVMDDGGPTGEILALFFDLSRRKEVEAEVRRAERLSALGRLSAGVAHEIRNPLAGIRTTAELLKSRCADGDERARFAEVILEETIRLDRIVGSLLQFAKPAEPKLEPIDLDALLDRAVELAHGNAAEHCVRIRRVSRRSPAFPLADRDQILQVLLNLILNAIEATPAGGEVRVGADAPATSRSSSIAIRVEDGGEGVPPSIRERIFDPFFTTKPGGTGLGLSISEHIVRRHGGSIQMEKAAGASHAAVVRLPIHASTSVPRGGIAWPAS
jgi:signal transduction histidine kinase